MSSTVLSTLYSITTTKEQELAKQRDECKSLKKELLHLIEEEQDSRQRVKLLLKEAGTLEAAKGRRRRYQNKKVTSSQHQEILKLAGISPYNLQRFIEQSYKDQSISPAVFQNWEKKIREALVAQQVKYDYATLFSNLVTERAANNDKASSASEDGASFDKVGRPEMHKQRKEWEEFVFNANNIDKTVVTEALRDTFQSPEAKVAIDNFREHMEIYSRRLRQSKFDVSVVKWSVKGLLSSDLLSEDQSTALKQMSENTIYLSEIADVLNLRLASLEKWSWDGEAVEVEMRRQLNGKYRVYMIEELTQALFLYYIGANWASEFRKQAFALFKSTAWLSRESIDGLDKAKWEYFCADRELNPGTSIDDTERRAFEENCFMSMLPPEPDSSGGQYDSDGHDDQTGSATDSKNKANGMKLKQGVLHDMTADSLLADRLGQDLLVVLQTDFRWFGPSISHSALEAVLQFFGIDDLWLKFFKKFLESPLRFVHDGKDGQIRTRKRGTAMNHLLSDFFGESMLFCLDFAVNQATGGIPMRRLHDDVWFIGSPSECELAWGALKSLATQLAIDINYEKTGTGIITSRKNYPELPSSLPTGSLKWGFLKIDGAGQWKIDQSLIDEHIAELRRQLEATSSIFEWIRAYNVYAKFIIGNFCPPAVCLGQAHVDDCLSTLHRVHAELLPETKGSVAAYVKSRIEAKFGISDIPDGFIYFPQILGGLELHNAFVTLQNQRVLVEADPGERIDEALKVEEAFYNDLKRQFEKSGPAKRNALKQAPKTFFTLDEYRKFRRSKSSHWESVWTELREEVVEERVERTEEIKQLLSILPDNTEGIMKDEDMTPYWEAVVELYGPEMGKVFGGLAIVEKGLLPLGMMSLFKGKFRWEG